MDIAADHSNTRYGDLMVFFSAQCTVLGARCSVIVIAMIWKDPEGRVNTYQIRLAKMQHTIAHAAS